jgi:uncharacterized protein
MAQQDIKPWYKQFWPYFAFTPAAFGVIGGLSLVVIASTNPDPLVVDDYYKVGRAFAQTYERDRVAEELGLSAEIGLDAELEMVRVALHGKETDDALVLHLVHPTRGDYDRTLDLRRGPNGDYFADLEPLRAGRWHLVLEPRESPRWRLTGRMSLPDEGRVLIAAGDLKG